NIAPLALIENLTKAGTPTEQAYARIMHATVNSIVDSFMRVPVPKRHDLIALDLLYLTDIADALRELHRRSSTQHSLMLVSKLSAQMLRDKDLAGALQCAVSLWEERVVHSTLLIHDRSNYALRVG